MAKKRSPWRAVAIGSVVATVLLWWRARARKRPPPPEEDFDPSRPTPKQETATTKPTGKPGKPIEVQDAWIAYPVDDVADNEKTLRDIKVFSEEGKEWIRGDLTVRYHVPGGPGLPGTWSEPCHLFAWDKTPLPDSVIQVESDTVTLLQTEGCRSARDDLLRLRISPVAGGDYALSLYIDTPWKIWVQGHVDVGSTTVTT